MSRLSKMQAEIEQLRAELRALTLIVAEQNPGRILSYATMEPLRTRAPAEIEIMRLWGEY